MKLARRLRAGLSALVLLSVGHPRLPSALGAGGLPPRASQTGRVAVAAPRGLSTLWMTTDRYGWAQSAHALWRTADGAESWQQVLALRGGSAANVVAVLGANWAAVVSAVPPKYTDLHIERTIDGGRNWKTYQVPLGHTRPGGPVEPEDLDALSNTKLYVLVRTEEGMNSPNGELLTTDNGGRSWAVVGGAGAVTGRATGRLPSAIGSVAMAASGEGWLMARATTTAAPRLYRTTDGGRSWSLGTLPTVRGKPLLPLAPPELFPISRQWLLVANVEVNGVTPHTCDILVAPESRATWQRTAACQLWLSASGRVVSPFFLSARVGWEVSGGRVLLTQDGGVRWLPLSRPGGRSLLSSHVLALDFVSKRRGWVVLVRRSGEPVVFETGDGGLSWQEL